MRPFMIFNTGERPQKMDSIEEMDSIHSEPYYYLSKWFNLKGKDVLDIGCGNGCGVYHLAKTAEWVIGIDNSWSAIKECYRKFNNQSLAFSRKGLSHLEYRYDLIICSQVLEHVGDYYSMLLHIERLLKPDGIAIIVTPNKNYYSKGKDRAAMPFHVHEFYPRELESLCKGIFSSTSLMYLTDVNIKTSSKANEWEASKKGRLIRKIQQNPICRSISRLVPSFIKYAIAGNKMVKDRPEYKVVSGGLELEQTAHNIFIIVRK